MNVFVIMTYANIMKNHVLHNNLFIMTYQYLDLTMFGKNQKKNKSLINITLTVLRFA